jgi:hypothetical protein
MKIKYGKPVQWRDGEAHLTGVLVLDEHNDCIGHQDDPNMVLVAHSFTRELEFVAWHKLSPYPAEPIPQP